MRCLGDNCIARRWNVCNNVGRSAIKFGIAVVVLVANKQMLLLLLSDVALDLRVLMDVRVQRAHSMAAGLISAVPSNLLFVTTHLLLW